VHIPQESESKNARKGIKTAPNGEAKTISFPSSESKNARKGIKTLILTGLRYWRGVCQNQKMPARALRLIVVPPILALSCVRIKKCPQGH